MNQQEIIEKYVGIAPRLKTSGKQVVEYEVSADKFAAECKNLYQDHHLSLKTMTALDDRAEGGSFVVTAIFGVPGENVFLAPYVRLKGTAEFPSLTAVIPGALGYERKIKTFFGLLPKGLPDQRPILLQENWPSDVFPLRKDFNWQDRPGAAQTPYPFHVVEGEGIYEIPVGPVHAGIIEPGHFRFSVAGEEIVNLEAKLGYKHKGTEKLFEILPLAEKVRLSERVSGDSSFSHSLAFCQAVESLGKITVPERALYLRVIYAELERLANHLGDVGFIMMDTGYSFGGSNGGRLREMVMQWNEKLAGHRFLRGVNVIGGVNKDISDEMAKELLESLIAIEKDFGEVLAVAEESSSLKNRLEGTGILDKQIAADYGAVGVPARAAGFALDARKDYPYAAYGKLSFQVVTEPVGDVNARYRVRIKEIRSSFGLIKEALAKLPAGQIKTAVPAEFLKSAWGVGVAEGWRGDIVYFVATDKAGQITRVDVRDPSFINWMVVGHAGRGNVVPDFPLINKSFNLSYSGNDV